MVVAAAFLRFTRPSMQLVATVEINKEWST
jgi:hypothetical protein